MTAEVLWLPSFSCRQSGRERNQPMQGLQNGEPASPPHFNGRGVLKGAWFPLALARGGARQAGEAWGQLRALISAPSGSTLRESLRRPHWPLDSALESTQLRLVPGVDAGSGTVQQP